MRKFINKISVLFCLSLVTLCVIGLNKESIKTPIRDVSLTEQSVDYQSMFNEFEESELVYDESTKHISFSGIQSIDSSILDEIDLVSITTDSSKELDLKYSFEYYEEENIFILNVTIVNVDGGEILDSVVGVPFLDENKEVDIAFAVEDEVILLSELEENPLLQNCGWFTKALKKVAKKAAVIVAAAVVATVIVVAAPAVVAAGSVLATSMAASGGVLALSGASAAAAMAAAGTAAAAAAATVIPVMTVAAATAIVATAADTIIDGALEESKSNTDSSTSEGKSNEIKDVDVNALPENVQKAYNDYDEVNWDDEIYTGSDSKANANTEYENRNGKLPQKDSNGNDITYKEYDVNDCKKGIQRDNERFVKGSDGSIYYTDDHYKSFKKVK